MTQTKAFEFVTLLAHELSEGKIELPGFPRVFAQVCSALNDPATDAAKMASIVGAEPALAARLLAMANSVAFNESGRAVGDLPAAIVRLGDMNVRSSASAFAMAQVRHQSSLQAVSGPLRRLWERSTLVAALSYVIAGRSSVNPDEAFLAGLMHGIGRLYLLARISERGDLANATDEMRELTDGWHAAIGKSLLEHWNFPAGIVEAVEEQDNAARRPHAAADVADVLICARYLGEYAGDLASLRTQVDNNRAFRQLRLSQDICAAIIKDAAVEIDALRSALGE